MLIDLGLVQKLADLARVELDPTQAERLRGDLETILGHVRSLETINTEGVRPWTTGGDNFAPLRPDQPEPSLSVDELASMGSTSFDPQARAFIAPAVFGDMGDEGP